MGRPAPDGRATSRHGGHVSKIERRVITNSAFRGVAEPVVEPDPEPTPDPAPEPTPDPAPTAD